MEEIDQMIRMREAEIEKMEVKISGMNICIEKAQWKKEQASERLNELKDRDNNDDEGLQLQEICHIFPEVGLDELKEHNMRLKLISKIFPEVGQAYKFIDENRNVFRGKVWGPIAAQVQPKNLTTASYLENHVAIATWKTFVVECTEDSELLHREVCERRGIFISIIVVNEGTHETRPRMYSDERMSVLRREHFFGYLDETFTTPDAIMQVLTSRFNVDRILVGGDAVRHSLELGGLIDFLSMREDQRPRRRPSCFFYTCKDNGSFKYTSQVSRFTGLLGSAIDDVGPAKLIAPSSELLKTQLNMTIQEADEFIAKLQPMVDATIAKLDEMNKRDRATQTISPAQLTNLKRTLERKDEEIASLEASLKAALKRPRTDNSDGDFGQQ